MLKLYVIPFIVVLIPSIASTAFEDNEFEHGINLIYKINANLDDLVLNYCSSYDSYTINRLFSQKNTHSNLLNKSNDLKNIFVTRKDKPLNRKIVNKIQNEIQFDYFSSRTDKLININHLKDSKKEFVQTLLPIISYENQKILLERKKLISISKILNNQQTLDNRNINFLNKVAKKYKVKVKNKHKIDLINDLLDLVDIIPNSIVLAQAANESGWGTSRFAREYNALFGEYTYNFSDGVVPLLRDEGKKHLVKSFTSFDKSVQSYFKNLNTHYAYKNFRKVRKVMRQNNNFKSIELLVEMLDTYAADTNYIDTINAIINSNKLQIFDSLTYTNIQS